MNKLKLFIKIAVVVMIVLFALFPRSVEVLSGNYLFGFDQGRDYLAVWDIVINKKFTLIGSEWGAGSAGFTGLFHGPFYYYLLSIAFLIFHGDPYGGMVLMWVLSVGFLIAVYFIGRYFFNRSTAIIFSLLVTVAPPFIAHARFIWNSHPSPIFIIISIYYIYRMTKTETTNVRYIFLASFFSGFIYNFQSGIALPMSLTLFIYVIFVLKLKGIRSYVFLFSGYFLAFLPLLLFNVRHNFISFRGMTSYLTGSPDTTTTPMIIVLILRDHFNSFVFNFFDSFPRQPYIVQRVFFIVTTSFTFYLFFNEQNKPMKKLLCYLLLLPCITFGIFSFLRNAVYAYYLIHLNIVYLLLFCYVWYRSQQSSYRIMRLFLIGFIMILIYFHTPWVIQNSLQDYKDYGGVEKMAGKKDAIDYIIQWYGRGKYGYIPYKDTKDTFYLLMQRDSSKPFSYIGWLETVIKKGKIIDTVELPSGFLVQKRIE